MAIKKYFLKNNITGKITNKIVLDLVTDPIWGILNHSLIEITSDLENEGVDIGWTWDGNVWISPEAI